MSTNGSSRIEVMTPYVYFIVLSSATRGRSTPASKKGPAVQESEQGERAQALV